MNNKMDKMSDDAWKSLVIKYSKLKDRLGIGYIPLLNFIEDRKGWCIEPGTNKIRRVYLYDLPDLKKGTFKGNIAVGAVAYYEVEFQFKDYGKTWALTKEELEANELTLLEDWDFVKRQYFAYKKQKYGNLEPVLEQARKRAERIEFALKDYEDLQKTCDEQETVLRVIYHLIFKDINTEDIELTEEDYNHIGKEDFAIFRNWLKNIKDDEDWLKEN